MKKLVLTLTATLACLGAFAQGKIGFQTDSAHLVYYATTDPTYGGQAVVPGSGPSNVTFMADLYVGTSAASLQLITSAGFSPSPGPGKWATLQVSVPGTAAGQVVFVEAQVRDSLSTAPPVFAGHAVPGAGDLTPWYGASQEFQFTLGGPITSPVMWGANGNWAAGTQPVSGATAGALGAIGISTIPEPASFALAGLGAAMLVIFRRRK